MTVGMTANEVGAFMEYSISDRALRMQLYIAVAALTTLGLAAIVSERRRAALDRPAPFLARIRVLFARSAAGQYRCGERRPLFASRQKQAPSLTPARS
jgi:hypothetical protein